MANLKWELVKAVWALIASLTALGMLFLLLWDLYHGKTLEAIMCAVLVNMMISIEGWGNKR